MFRIWSTACAWKWWLLHFFVVCSMNTAIMCDLGAQCLLTILTWFSKLVYWCGSICEVFAVWYASQHPLVYWYCLITLREIGKASQMAWFIWCIIVPCPFRDTGLQRTRETNPVIAFPLLLFGKCGVKRISCKATSDGFQLYPCPCICKDYIHKHKVQMEFTVELKWDLD